MTSCNGSILAWAFIVFVSGVALSCKASARPGYFEDDKKTAERAIDQFHAKYNAGQHEEVYREASEPLRGSVTEEAWLTLLSECMNKQARCKRSQTAVCAF